MVNKNITSESSIEKYFVRKCKEQKMKVIKMVPTFECGMPDRQVLFLGVSGFCELKRPGAVPKKHQVAYLNELSKAGFFTGVVDSKESAQQWILDFVKHCNTILK
jgi:hypothetical protein